MMVLSRLLILHVGRVSRRYRSVILFLIVVIVVLHLILSPMMILSKTKNNLSTFSTIIPIYDENNHNHNNNRISNNDSTIGHDTDLLSSSSLTYNNETRTRIINMYTTKSNATTRIQENNSSSLPISSSWAINNSTTTTNTTSTIFLNSGGDPLKDDNLTQQKQQQQQQQHEATSSSTSTNTTTGFAACLMIMDDNHYLIEWLAYHYTILPLKRLIVAIDPYSTLSPVDILNRYHTHNLIDITIWNDLDYLSSRQSRYYLADEDHGRAFTRRQNMFLMECLRVLKLESSSSSSEEEDSPKPTTTATNTNTTNTNTTTTFSPTKKWTWVTSIDTDEYIAWSSHYADNDHQLKDRTPFTIFDKLNSPKNTFKMKNKTIPNSCRPMRRLNMGIKEIESSSSSNNNMSETTSLLPHNLHDFQSTTTTKFQERNFITFRYRFPQQLQNTIFLPGKVMIDISQLNLSTDFRISGNFNPHHLVKSLCPIQQYVFFPSIYSPFIVYQYAGTWEQFTYRKDGRLSRTNTTYKERWYDNQFRDDSVVGGSSSSSSSSSTTTSSSGGDGWLSVFISQVGKELAFKLLDGIGQVGV